MVLMFSKLLHPGQLQLAAGGGPLPLHPGDPAPSSPVGSTWPATSRSAGVGLGFKP